MKFITHLSKVFGSIILLFNAIAAHATIPNSITGTYSVASSDNCPNNCTIQTGGTLIISGSGTTATFSGDITVSADATLIVNGATIKVAAGKKIILTNGVQQPSTLTNPFGLQPGAHLTVSNGALITSVGNAPDQALWGGIECSGAPFDISYSTITYMEDATIRYAECAYRNFDPVQGYYLAKGIFRAENTTFLDNQRMLDIGNTYLDLGPNGIWVDDITWIGCYAESCTFRLTAAFDPPSFGIPHEMVYMHDGAGLFLHSCDFIAEYYDADDDTYNFDYLNNTTAIDASFFAILWADQQQGSASGCNFSGFLNGIVVDNSVGDPYNTIVSNASFVCVNAINLSSNRNPLLVGNQSWGPVTASASSPYTASDYCSIFLRNCSEMRVEGNAITYDADRYAHCYGIVAMNSGDADNNIYRNSVDMLTAGVSIESIGTNRASDGTSGLKILCNQLDNSTDFTNSFNIAVMQDAVGNPAVNGIHNDQYDGNRSAGNKFQSYSSTTYSSYYLESGTNNMSAFAYKYNTSTADEQPLYHNITNLLSTGTVNTCPEIITRDPQPSMASAPSNEKNVRALHEEDEEGEARPAAAGLSPEQTRNLNDMQATMKWLNQNNNNWAAMPTDMKETVHRVEGKDATKGGAIARGLLHFYEGKKYPPVVILPDPEKPLLAVKGLNVSLYPNPAHAKTEVNWGGTTATLHIINIQGQTCLTQIVEKGITAIDISSLAAGTYLVQIQNNNSQAYTQKLTVK